MDNMSWEMSEVYGAITDQILINLSRYFPYFKAGNVPKSAFEYQANMLAQMGQVNADTIKIIRNGLGGANKALSHVLEQAIIESVKKSQPELLKAVQAGILKPAGIPIVAPTQMRAFSLYYQQAAQKLNLVNTVMLESTKQAYQATVSDIANRVQVVQTALDIGAGETLTGVSTWNQALRHSINRMKDNGIVGFIDHGNHRWSAEAYTAMDIRTTVANTARAAVWETNQDFGNDLYIVSYHDGARPLCYPWQNKVISATNNARIVQDLDGNDIEVIAQSDTSYGEAAGLFGINCKHYPSPFIPGVSVMYDSSEIPSEKENEKIYEQTQQQRGLERKLREEKRDLLMAKEMGADADEIKALRERCRQTSDDIDKFCEETGLPRRQNREGVFTQRSFPDKDTYDPALFERQQKEEIDKYFKNGGAQTGYTFGQMDAGTKLSETDYSHLKTAEDYDREIQRLRDRRFELIDKGNYNKAETDKLLDEIFNLQDKKAALNATVIPQNPAQQVAPSTANSIYTLKDASVTHQPMTVNPGTTAEIQLANADVYTMPDGTQFVFKHNMDKAHQTLDPDTLVDTYYKVPPELRAKGQKTVNVVDRYNKDDAYWRKKYKKFKHSYMTGGKQITIYRHDYKHDLDYMLFSIEHEIGHNIDRISGQGTKWYSELQEWIDAMAKDKTVSGLDSWRSYGNNSNTEDFADSIGYYFTKHDDFIKKMPNRSALIEKLLGIGGASP